MDHEEVTDIAFWNLKPAVVSVRPCSGGTSSRNGINMVNLGSLFNLRLYDRTSFDALTLMQRPFRQEEERGIIFLDGRVAKSFSRFRAAYLIASFCKVIGGDAVEGLHFELS